MTLDTQLGHGGLIKNPGVAQRYQAAAAHTAVTCTETAGEGGPYGMALLAAYRVEHADGETLASYLQTRVFAGAASTTLNPDAADEAGFAAFLKEYKKALCAERNAVETILWKNYAGRTETTGIRSQYGTAPPQPCYLHMGQCVRH